MCYKISAKVIHCFIYPRDCKAISKYTFKFKIQRVRFSGSEPAEGMGGRQALPVGFVYYSPAVSLQPAKQYGISSSSCCFPPYMLSVLSPGISGPVITCVSGYIILVMQHPFGSYKWKARLSHFFVIFKLSVSIVQNAVSIKG